MESNEEYGQKRGLPSRHVYSLLLQIVVAHRLMSPRTKRHHRKTLDVKTGHRIFTIELEQPSQLERVRPDERELHKINNRASARCFCLRLSLGKSGKTGILVQRRRWLFTSSRLIWAIMLTANISHASTACTFTSSRPSADFPDSHVNSPVPTSRSLFFPAESFALRRLVGSANERYTAHTLICKVAGEREGRTRRMIENPAECAREKTPRPCLSNDVQKSNDKGVGKNRVRNTAVNVPLQTRFRYSLAELHGYTNTDMRFNRCGSFC